MTSGRAGDARGFTLVEALVATALAAVLVLIVLTLHDGVLRAYETIENAATRQQNTRAVFDRLVSDIRMAGFNANPDGDPDRPAEPIEGMWATAIALRADFDFEDPDTRATPESVLGGEGMPFRVVSVGNDEVVTYALGKPGARAGASIGFVADVRGVPRDGVGETVTINGVHLLQDDPPYTLYRWLVGPDGTAVVKQPVADHIASLALDYYDKNGAELAPAGGEEDGTSIAQRGRIRRIRIRVVGLADGPDPEYTDPDESNPAMRHFRKFPLEADILPRNLGYAGTVEPER